MATILTSGTNKPVLIILCLLSAVLLTVVDGRTISSNITENSDEKATLVNAPARNLRIENNIKENYPMHPTPTTHEIHSSVTTANDGSHGNSTGTGEGEWGQHGEGEGHHETPPHIEVAGWNWHHVKQPFIITMVLIAAAILKLAFHHAGRLPQIVPESCVLIILGTMVGGILYAGDFVLFSDLRPSFFFLVLLPPIILESSYSLYDRVFFDNLGTILLYAVVGTVLNCFLIGPVLYGLAQAGAMGGISITFIQCLVFASLIVAVDPVAVLAIFQEIGVNNVLYFLVFGESLLNDAVTVVLYNMMIAFNGMDSVPVSEIFLGIASFFTISLLGMTIGIVFGILTALFTKYTTKVRVVEPLTVFALAYASYLTADLFKFSGIISIFSCGLVQAHFAFHNVSHKSSTTILYFSKILSTTSDTIIFMFLGLALWNLKHVWHTGFVCWTVVLCLVFRFIVVYFLTFLANKMKRIRKIDYEEQFIMAYGGLRGAVAFSLVAMLNPKDLPDNMQPMFETTTLVVVLFTVFVQGITIKPLVKLLRIRKEGVKVVSLCDEITNHVTDHLMAGIEEIVGYSGRNTLRETLDYYDDKYFKRFLQRSPLTKDEHIMELYKEIAIQDHYDNLACNVDMDRYSSQMMLYHPIKEDVEDDTFVSMAATHPELANMALDNHLRRRTLSRGYHTLSRSRAMTVPNRMFSDPGPDYTSPVVHDVESIGYPQKTTSIDTEPPATGDVTVNDLRRMLVKPSEAYHQKHNRNILDDGTQDLVQLLQEKQKRTTRYLRAMSMSMSPESGTPAEGSPVLGRHPFAFPRQRSKTHSGNTLYRKSFPGGRIRYDSDGPLTSHHHRGASSPPITEPLGSKNRSASVGAVSGPYGGSSDRISGAMTPPLETIKEVFKKSVSSDTSEGQNNNGVLPKKKDSTASEPSEAGASSKDDSQAKTRRCALARQDKVHDVSPTKSHDGGDAETKIVAPRDEGKSKHEETRL